MEAAVITMKDYSNHGHVPLVYKLPRDLPNDDECLFEEELMDGWLIIYIDNI